MKRNYLTSVLAGSLLSYVATAQVVKIDSSGVYAPKDTNNSVRVMTKANGLSEDLIFQHDNHWVKLSRADGYVGRRRSLEAHDFMQFIPDPNSPNTKGKLFVNHEIFPHMEKDTAIAFGGSVSIVKVEKVANKWKIAEDAVLGDTSIAVDFSPVGFTTSNCGGLLLSTGNVLTGEEIFTNFNNRKFSSSRLLNVLGRFGYDKSDSTYTIPASYPEFGGKKINWNHNFGWMTEVDLTTAKAVRKNYHMGRYSHEGGSLLTDNKTIILTDDFAGAGLFKFVADTAGDFSKGNLYAFKQLPNSYKGVWVQIDRNIDSLINARDVAFRKGATIFMRLEWSSVDTTNNTVYISETGRDRTSNQSNVVKGVTLGASIPRHWTHDISAGDSVSWDPTTKKMHLPYGTVLKLTNANSDTSTLVPFLRGGFNTARTFNFNSVDGQNIAKIGNKNYLLLTEDNIGTDKGRISPNYVGKYPYEYPKAFLLDLTIPNPTRDDLMLVLAGSRDTELTGGTFTPDGNTLFIVNQHPNQDANDAPYDKSAVFAFSGFANGLVTNLNLIKQQNNLNELTGYPNPVVSIINLNKVVSGSVFDFSGKLVYNVKERDFINVANFKPGTYMLRTVEGQTLKFVVQ